MKIDVAFNEGEEIFFISNAKVVKSVVRGFKIDHIFSNGEPIEVVYLCNSDESEKQVNIKVPSSLAFKSKEALLQSL